jgi:hypothetical protein
MSVFFSFLAACACLTLIQLGMHSDRLAWIGCTGILGLLVTGGALLGFAARDCEKRFDSPLQWGIALTVLGLYIGACVTPTFYGDDGDVPGVSFGIGSPIGLEVLCMGAQFAPIPWSANLLLPLGVSCLARGRAILASLVGLAGCAIACTSWWEGERLLTGYYVWQSSFLALAIGPVLLLFGRSSLHSGGNGVLRRSSGSDDY